MATIVERHRDKIRGVLSCLDRVIWQGTLPGIGHANGMTSYLSARGIRIFDYARFAEPLRDEIRANAERVARDNGIEIEFIRRSSMRQRGAHQGDFGHSRRSPGARAYLFRHGRKLHPNYQDQLGNDFSTRIEGTRIKHYMGPASIKMYDKAKIVLRIETTANDVSFFKHYRKVEQRDGTIVHKDAPLKKCIYSLPDLRELLAAANRRYLEFISQLEDPSSGSRNLDKVTQTVVEQGRTYKGFNFFSDIDLRLSLAVLRGEHSISGLRNKDLQRHLPDLSSGTISRQLKRLRVHGLVKRIGHSYKYYVTALGRCAMIAGLKLKELFLTPELARV